jgi:hypothetical protein
MHPHRVKLPPPPFSAIFGQLLPGRPSGYFLCLYLLFTVLLLFPCSFFVLLFLLFRICFVFACYFTVVFGLLFDFSATLSISSASVSPSSIHCRAFFSRPHCNELSTPLSLYGFGLHAIGFYFPVFLLFICL